MSQPVVTWPFPGGLGAIIAVVVLILCLILAIIGKMPWFEAGLFAALAVARLT